MSKTRSNWLLLLAAVAIVTAPLVIPGIKGEFKGSDDQATEAIAAAKPDFKPWFAPVWQPPSNEIQSLLFALQAALGAGVLGYVIGRRRSGRSDDVARR
jgi:cobalt/nickel transport protein